MLALASQTQLDFFVLVIWKPSEAFRSRVGWKDSILQSPSALEVQGPHREEQLREKIRMAKANAGRVVVAP